MSKLIDVIVPIYNVEQYLCKCVDSLLNQEFDDYVITLVDDGSPDNCPDICDKYKEKYPEKIRVIHKENGGVSSARNIGIEKSESKYISFVDPDDYVSADYLKDLYDAHIKYDAEVVISNAYRVFVDDNGSERESLVQRCDDILIDKETALEHLFYEHKFSSYAWGKLFIRDMLIKHPYPMGKIYEDSSVTYKVLNDCSKVACISNINYYYLQRSGSLLHTRFDEKNMSLYYSAIEAIDYLQNFEISKKVKKALSYRVCYTSYATLMRALELDKEGYIQVYGRIKDNYRLHLKTALSCDISLKEKLLFCVSCLFPRLYRMYLKRK